MDTPGPEAALSTVCYLLEDDTGCLFLLAPALLDGCRVPEAQAGPLTRLVVGAELSEAGVMAVLDLFAPMSDDDVHGLSTIAARRLRAWAVLR
jgi:hypothetical protein